jgi:hypothetical protein
MVCGGLWNTANHLAIPRGWSERGVPLRGKTGDKGILEISQQERLNPHRKNLVSGVIQLVLCIAVKIA